MTGELAINRGVTEEVLGGDYLFAEVARRVAEHTAARGEKPIDLGIGDVTLPLPACVAEALATASAGMGSVEGFRGYPPADGYDFLRRAISELYAEEGARVPAGDIFISDGAKTDLALIPHLFGRCTVYLADPTYPAYRDVNLAAGNGIRYLRADIGNDLLPLPDAACGRGIYYICTPGNPTGAAYDRARLAVWVEHALATGSLIVCDTAYSAFIPEDDTEHPRTIYSVPGAEKCALEVGSFSKSAGFTGLRCGFTVLPSELRIDDRPLRDIWRRYKAITSNGVAYPVQCAAAAALTPQGRAGYRENIKYYLGNARILRAALAARGIGSASGEMSPYVWFRCPDGLSSWKFFDRLLDRAGIIGTPGSGFGAAGEGCFRFSAFCSRPAAMEAARRLREV